jgi:hypothetical protein
VESSPGLGLLYFHSVLARSYYCTAPLLSGIVGTVVLGIIGALVFASGGALSSSAVRSVLSSKRCEPRGGPSSCRHTLPDFPPVLEFRF